MPVFFKANRRVLFVHVPKAGGTSIEMFFAANGFGTAYLDRGDSPASLNPVRRCSPQHMHADLLQTLFDPAQFTYVFMTVRHPIRRLLSKFVMETGEAESVSRLEDWILRDFSQVFAIPTAMDNHLRPQSDFLLPQAKIHRLEDGFNEPFVARLEAGIGLDFAHRKVGREMHGRTGTPDFSALRPSVQDLIRTYYARDFATFNYPP